MSRKRSNIFRKTALDHLSSPERLDQVVEVTGYGSWAALIALLGISCVALIWAFKGTVATTASGTGLIVRQGRVLVVPARSSGIVLSLELSAGDHVKVGQHVATVAQEKLFADLQSARQALAERRQEQSNNADLRREETELALQAQRVERDNIRRAIKDFKAEAALASDRIPVMDELFSKGLVTEQNTIEIRQEHARILRSISDLSAEATRIDAEGFALRSQLNRSLSEDALELADLERTITTMASDLSLAQTVVSPHRGRVLELQVDRGAAVSAGTPILTLQPEGDQLEALIYLPARDAKDVREGMEVQLSPTHIRREEFGFIVGRVVYVAEHPATDAALMRNFQNAKLVTALLSDGPVIEARVELMADHSTPTGFQWSSSSGPDAALSSGTFCDAFVVVRRQAPVTLFVPYLKSLAGLR